jgi:hypothetical protein
MINGGRVLMGCVGCVETDRYPKGSVIGSIKTRAPDDATRMSQRPFASVACVPLGSVVAKHNQTWSVRTAAIVYIERVYYWII